MQLSAMLFEFFEGRSDIFFRHSGVVFEAVAAKQFSRSRNRCGDYCSEGGYIWSEIFELAMSETKREGGFCGALSGIAEDIATEHRNQQGLIEGARAPTD